jgi:3-oxoacyl-[acyl-carrier-protein] synthase-3
MDGQEVFKFAVKKVPECIEQVLLKANTEIEQVKYFCLHQANKRIINSVAKRLKQPEEKFPMNLDQYGNTSAASIPILLDELYKKGQLEKGDKILLSGFGGGLTWGAALVE